MSSDEIAALVQARREELRRVRNQNSPDKSAAAPPDITLVTAPEKPPPRRLVRDQPTSESRQKTCHFWANTSHCRKRAEDCAYAHEGRDEIAEPNDYSCYFWATSECTRDEKDCEFAHGPRPAIAGPPPGYGMSCQSSFVPAYGIFASDNGVSLDLPSAVGLYRGPPESAFPDPLEVGDVSILPFSADLPPAFTSPYPAYLAVPDAELISGKVLVKAKQCIDYSC
jgi:hypothetical protein